MNYSLNKIELKELGFSITPEIYNNKEIEKIIQLLDNIQNDSPSIIKTNDLFAIRQLMIISPELWNIIQNQNLTNLTNEIGGKNCFLTKAIYFDKPKGSNWFVPYHQDLSINITKKIDTKGYVNWTFKRKQIGVQPPVNILENIFTIRIHLDDTDRNNGALKVIPKSHRNGIIRKNDTNTDVRKEVICELKKGQVMIMKPLIMHASNRTINDKRRRVIHLEFSDLELKEPMNWKERKSRTHNTI
jgi:ectoine hydroxylase-related dioxygenase (phytanoyl-CoA dioxygenase family)